MLSKRIGRVGILMLAVAAAALLVVSPVTAAHRTTKATNLVVWVDSPQKASIEKSAKAWGKAPVTVQVHTFGNIRDDLKTVKPENAPDIVIGRARLGRRARHERPDPAALPERGDEEAVPEVRTRTRSRTARR